MKKIKLIYAISILVINLNSTALAQAPPDIDTGPSWSTDGKKLGFASGRNGGLDIYTVNSDGSHITQLTTNGSQSQYPVWSPDSKKMLFVSNRDGNPEIYVMDEDGKNQKKLTKNIAIEEGRPGWFPDGKKIIFASNRNGNYDLYSVDTGGNNLRQITHDDGEKTDPAVSPDGNKIIYTVREGRNSSIYCIDTNGGNKKLLSADGSYASWSKDGKQIIFQTNRDGKTVNGRIPAPEIYVMKADGSDQKNISNNDYWDFYCYFSPDGRSIVFTSMRDGNQEVYTMNVDGTNVKRITYN
jgi:Tol biopolymer transport system component